MSSVAQTLGTNTTLLKETDTENCDTSLYWANNHAFSRLFKYVPGTSLNKTNCT